MIKMKVQQCSRCGRAVMSVKQNNRFGMPWDDFSETGMKN
jgi:hypothetical protein